MNIIKIDDNTIEVTKEIPQEVIPAKEEVKTYDFDFLIRQKAQVEQDLASIIARHARELAPEQANLDEVNFLLIEAGKLGIVERVEPTEELPVIDDITN